MLYSDFERSSFEWGRPAQPFIDHYAKSILITGRSCLTPHLFGCEIERSTCYLLSYGLCAIGAARRRKERQAKVAQQEIILRIEEHVLWFDIAVNHASVMSIL